jgi:hypothetical protein
VKCKKKKYASQKDAKKDMRAFSGRFRVYFCKMCNAYHSTTKKFDDYSETKKYAKGKKRA